MVQWSSIQTTHQYAEGQCPISVFTRNEIISPPPRSEQAWGQDKLRKSQYTGCMSNDEKVHHPTGKEYPFSFNSG